MLRDLDRCMRLTLLGIEAADAWEMFKRRRLVSRATLIHERDEARREVIELRMRIAAETELRRKLDDLEWSLHGSDGFAADEAAVYLRGYLDGQADTRA
jgi:hypothetical protein